MRGALFAAAAWTAALAIPAAPAAAREGRTSAAPSSSHWSSDRDMRRDDGDWRRDRDRRRHPGNRTIFYGDREYQGDSAWRSDSFNDWWHERPHRSYPAWMSRNTDCERLWWSGGGWRC